MHRDEDFKNDEITLKELIQKIIEYANEVITYWWVVAFFCAVFVTGFVYQHKNFEPAYAAELKFVVEGQTGGGGGLSKLLGSIGMNKGGKINPYKIIEVGKSYDILLKVLSEPIESNSNLANAILKEYKLIDKWSEVDANFTNFQFGEAITNSGSVVERTALKRLRTMIWGNKSKVALTSLNLDDDTGIYSVVTETSNEQISILLSQKIYDSLKLFFEEEVFINQKQLADILTSKADSIKILSEEKIRQLARFEDSNRGVISNISSVTSSILNRDIYTLKAAYAEVLKNREMTDVTLKDMQPLFIPIDVPFSPISPSRSSLLIALIKGMFIGGFLAILFLLCRKVYRDIMEL